jgi:hypothetical protein
MAFNLDRPMPVVTAPKEWSPNELKYNVPRVNLFSVC